MIPIGEVIAWKYGNGAAYCEDNKIVVWRLKDKPQPDEVQLSIDKDEYIEFKKNELKSQQIDAELPKPTDAILSIQKILSHLKSQGLDLGPDGDQFIASIDAVNEKRKPK